MIDENSSLKSVTNLTPESEQTQNQLSTSRDHKRTTVRFTDDEFERIKSDAKLIGESIPVLLRSSYFRKRKVKLLFDEVDRHWVCAELRRIGNNVNQIAKRVNSGVLEGWHSEFEKVLKLLSEIQQMAAGAYGIR